MEATVQTQSTVHAYNWWRGNFHVWIAGRSPQYPSISPSFATPHARSNCSSLSGSRLIQEQDLRKGQVFHGKHKRGKLWTNNLQQTYQLVVPHKAPELPRWVDVFPFSQTQLKSVQTKSRDGHVIKSLLPATDHVLGFKCLRVWLTVLKPNHRSMKVKGKLSSKERHLWRGRTDTLDMSCAMKLELFNKRMTSPGQTHLRLFPGAIHIASLGALQFSLGKTAPPSR